jgi:hypothetical protein
VQEVARGGVFTKNGGLTAQHDLSAAVSQAPVQGIRRIVCDGCVFFTLGEIARLIDTHLRRNGDCRGCRRCRRLDFDCAGLWYVLPAELEEDRPPEEIGVLPGLIGGVCFRPDQFDVAVQRGSAVDLCLKADFDAVGGFQQTFERDGCFKTPTVFCFEYEPAHIGI